MPVPNGTETVDEFVSRCIPIVMDDGTAQDQDQAMAVCFSMYAQWEAEQEKADGVDVGGPGQCVCPDCGYITDKIRGVPCRSMECPECGASLVAAVGDEEGKGKMGKKERKAFPFELVKLDADGRTMEGYAAAFNNVDEVGDIIHPGAFAKTLAERGNKIRFLWQHDPGEPLGRPLEMREDERGLYVKARISKTARGNDAIALLQDGAINGLSIGYDSIKGRTDYTKEDGQTVRNLREVKLWEFSLVTFPANEEAMVLALKAVTPYQDLPLADRDREWDASAAEARVRAWADAEDEPNERYGRAFFWHDSEAPENFTGYKLGYADVVNGDLVAVPRGIFAVAGVLEGARGGADIPEEDQARVRGQVDRYYAKMREEFDDDTIIPPWDKAEGPNDGGADDKSEGEPEELKVGRAISKANEERILSAIDSIDVALEGLRKMLVDAIGGEDTAPATEAGRDAGDEKRKSAEPQEEAQPPALTLERDRLSLLMDLETL